MEVALGPSLDYQPFELQILDEMGQVVAQTEVKTREQVGLDLPLEEGPAGRIFRLHVDHAGSEPPP